MSATIAILPVGENSAAALTGFVTSAIATAKANIAALAGAVGEIVAADVSGETDLHKLYRLSSSGDSVSPQLLEALRKAA